MQPRSHRSDRNSATELRPSHPALDIRLHLGCGLDYHSGAINTDRYDLTAADLQADALRLPLRRGSVGQIEAQQVAEHLGYAGTLYALAEWRRVLARGGALLLETPDRPAACLAAAGPNPPAPALHWLFGLPWPGYTHRSLFDESELRALAEKAGLAEIEIARIGGVQPALRLSARKGDSAEADLWASLHVGFVAAGVLEPVTAPPHMAHLDALCDRILSAVADLPEEGPEACLQRVLGAAARLSPHAALAAIQVLVAQGQVPEDIARRFLDLARSLAEEAFPARLVAWLRRHPAPPGAQAVRLQRLDDRISHYLAARLFPGEAALQPIRQQFDAETAGLTAADREITFFCAETVTELSRRQTAQGARALARGDLEAAEAQLQAAAAYDADNALALWSRAHLALARGRRLEALEHYAALLELLPGAASALRPELDAVTGRQVETLNRFAGPPFAPDGRIETP